ncbi:MAG: hypothetical protein JWN76_1000 [Chitinophagaceae bacterium]|nr:hypothetical protein [Chitinophagaceae bacterium]
MIWATFISLPEVIERMIKFFLYNSLRRVRTTGIILITPKKNIYQIMNTKT